MNVAHSVNDETTGKTRMLHAHDIATAIAQTLPGVTYLLTTAKGITVPALLRYSTVLVIAVQLISDLVGRWLRRRRK